MSAWDASQEAVAGSYQSSQPKESALRRFFVRRRGDAPFKLILIHLLLIAYCIVSVYPALRVLSVSLRPGDRLLSTSLAIIPDDATLDSYVQLFTEKDFLVWLWNSLVITVTVSFVGVALSATSGYAFSRWKFPGRDVGLTFLLTTQMIPAGMLMIPLFILMVSLQFADTYYGILFAYSVTAVPFSIWILKGYYDTIPPDLEEAAMIDGASRLESFFRVILPLSTPSLAIVYLFNFMTAWNEFILARVLLKNADHLTWPIGLFNLIKDFDAEWGAYAASAVLITIPVVILFLFSSKWLISGLTLGSVKG
jgi:arabinogalactan oligomer/maltooligosaccharide transport system permease protein